MKLDSAQGVMQQEQNLSEIIIQSKNVPILASQFDIFAGKGLQKRLFSIDDNKAGFYGESVEIVPSSVTFANIGFGTARIGDAIVTSEELNNDEGIGLKNHLKKVLAKRTLKTITAQAFGEGTVGSTLTSFESILDYNAKTADKLINGLKIAETLGGITVANIDKVYGEFVQDNAGEAVWVVNNVADVIGLTDNDGKLLKTKDRNIETGSIGTIYGIPVHVQNLNGKAKMVLMNPKAYAVCVKESTNTKETVDVFPKAQTTITSNFFGDGKVVDPNAIKIIKA